MSNSKLCFYFEGDTIVCKDYLIQNVTPLAKNP